MPRYIYPFNARDTTSRRKKISMTWFKKNKYLDEPISQGKVFWARYGERVATLEFIIDMYEKMLHIKYTRHDRDQHIVEYENTITSIPCYWGGEKWFFICSGHKEYCGKRVRILYEHGFRFVCRTCANLSYDSCNENKLYRNNPFRMLTNVKKADALKMTMRKSTYKGKPTKKQRRVTELMGSITDEDIHQAEIQSFN